VLQVCIVPTAQAPWPAQVLLSHAPLAPHVSVSVPQLPHGTGFVWPGVQETQLPP
jgi:hypothetical protein